MVSYSFYESDSRVMQYARALAERGDIVDIIALWRPGTPKFEIVERVNVYRIQRRNINECGPLSHLYRICKFLLLSMFVLTVNHLRNHYKIVHVHSVPDFLILAALPARILGARVILDIHDILPEFYASKFEAKTDSLLYGMLLRIERLSARVANHVIVANHLWQERLIYRATRKEKCSVICNYPNSEIFHPRDKTAKNGRFVIMYPGTLNWHQGVDIAIRAFARVKDEIPDAVFKIFGEGPEKPALNALVQELQLEDRITISGYVPINQIADEMANADLAVVPKRASSPFGNEAASTKIPEFMALGVPLVISHTKIDSYYYDDSKVKFFYSDDEADLANCIVAMKRNPELQAKLVANAFIYIQENSWNVKKQEYLNLVDSLTAHEVRRRRALQPNV